MKVPVIDIESVNVSKYITKFMRTYIVIVIMDETSAANSDSYKITSFRENKPYLH